MPPKCNLKKLIVVEYMIHITCYSLCYALYEFDWEAEVVNLREMGRQILTPRPRWRLCETQKWIFKKPPQKRVCPNKVDIYGNFRGDTGLEDQASSPKLETTSH